ncbi:hypothetical protein F4861DRAFT_331387 [Xylaria intraflava]|nr:hypothetical protein F4861DRAFT_331387 [Xylaria intraflava]
MAIPKWTAIGCTAAGLSILAVSARSVPFHRARHEAKASPTHLGSFAVSAVAPRYNNGGQENYSLLIPARRLQRDLSDEEILARFTKGFFSRLSFTPERLLLSVFPFSLLTDVQAIKETLALRSQDTASELVVGPVISDPASISPKTTPSVLSLLFRNFLVLDSSLMTPAQRSQLPGDYARHARPPHAYVDFAWGGEGLGLVGCHRFEVRRRKIEQDADAEEAVEITFSSVSCLPRTGLAPSSGLLLRFHVLYSRLLFSDGIRGVLEG